MTTLRHLSSLADFRACVQLQRDTWGEGFSDVVPASLLQVSQKIGGLLAGAFEGEDLVGFVYSLLAMHEGRIAHWSHMLAVHESARGMGLGRRLKLFQREALLGHGVDTVFWTFDPMVARNAHLNINRLGAVVVRYVANMYGDETGSPLHAGGETDRFIVRWDLESQRTKWAVEGELAPQYAGYPDDQNAIEAPELGGGTLFELPEGDEVFVEIPADLAAAVAAGPDLRAWRDNVRRAFAEYLRRGYDVQSLYRDAASQRCFYYLRRR